MAKKKKVKILWDRVIIAVSLLFIIILIIVSLVSKKGSKNPAEETSETTTTSETTETTEPDNTINGNYDFISVSEDQVYKGNLILINSFHQYNGGTPENLLVIKENKTSDYKVAYNDLELDKDVITALNNMTSAFVSSKHVTDLMVSHAYRTPEDQQKKYDDALSADKDMKDSEYVKADFSEHNSGLAVDFGIFPPGDGTYPKFDGTGSYSWLADNARLYGFILRYTEDKQDQTGINADSTHFRYVGMPHSALMAQNKLCLEEYLEFIKTNYTFGQSNPCTVAIPNGVTYEIYYVAKSDGDTTQVPVPKDYPYTISGNNYDGFIVTVTK